MNLIPGFQDFFCRYRQFEEEHFDSFVHFMGTISSKLPSLLEEVHQEEMQFAPRFNIFRALDIERKEDVLHTPMLAHLLNPSAQHSQGSIFLKHFFETIRRHQNDIPDSSSLEEGHWMIQPEFYIGSGGIIGSRGIVDLLIENSQKKYVIVIENKIDTDDHNDQIPRYFTWLKMHRRNYKWRQLIYLTPNGRAPTSCQGCEYIRLSYSKDVIEFLEAAWHEVKAQSVQEVVRQYLAILKDWMEDNDD
jgi:hypothetical protein